MQDFNLLNQSGWNSLFVQGGILKQSKRSDIKACNVSSLLIVNDKSLWVFVEDCGSKKEVQLRLNISIDKEFKCTEHDVLFQPPRKEVKNFPECCRIDLFFHQSLTVVQKIESSEIEKSLTGLIIKNENNEKLGFFTDEDRPLDILITTDISSINDLAWQQQIN